MTLLWMSAWGGLLILLVWALRRPLLANLPARVMPVLWGVVLLRLLLPLALPVELGWQWGTAEAAVPVPMVGALPRPEAGEIWAKAGEGVVQEASLPEAEENRASRDAAPEAGTMPAGPVPTEAIGWAALGIWLAGALGMGGSFWLSYRRAKREFALARPAERGEAREVLDTLLARQPLRRKVELREWAQGDSPLTYGLLRPVILLPARQSWRDRGELTLMLAHELAHIRRLDVLYKLLAVGALCVHWFNPLVWLFVRLLGKDLELACDEAVARCFGGRARGGYARILLRLEAQRSGLAFGLGGMGKSTVEERIEMLMKNKTTTMAAVLAAALTIAGVTGVCALSTLQPRLRAAEPAGQTAAAGESVGTLPEEPTEQELLALYGPYGVTFEKGQMLLEGEPVRYFFDGVEVTKGARISHYEYCNDLGTVDACTVRGTVDNGDGSVNPFGPLQSIRRCTKEEFDLHTKDLAALNEGKGQVAVTEDSGSIAQSGESAATAGGQQRLYQMQYRCGDIAVYLRQNEATATGNLGSAAGGKTVAQQMLEYGAYGVTYRDGDIYYSGKRVGTFADVKPGGGVFSYDSCHGGEGILCATYDYNDRLYGLELFPEGTEISLNEPIRAAEETESLKESAAQWEETLAPYLDYGLTYEYDPVAGYRSGCGLTMWYNGQEVRAIWDETTGTYICEHQNGSSLHGTNDLCAVYQDGHLCGLRHYTGTTANTTTHHPEPQGHHRGGHHR